MFYFPDNFIAVLPVMMYWMSSLGLEFVQINNPYVTKQDWDMENKKKKAPKKTENTRKAAK